MLCMSDHPGDQVRVQLVERTYSDDEQNLIILTYATPDASGITGKSGRLRPSLMFATRPQPSTRTSTTSAQSMIPV